MSQRVEEIVARIEALPRPRLVAFDVDGTLAPVVQNPAKARVPLAVGRALGALAKRPRTRVALVTGRDAVALSRMVRITGLHRILEHGAVTLLPTERAQGSSVRRRPDARLADLAHWAEAHVVACGGLVEYKPNSLGIHVRAIAARDPKLARELLRSAERRIVAMGLHPRPGRAVIEAQLEPASKATALQALISRVGARGLAYFGDDLTDVPALRMVVRLGGIGVFVCSPERPRAPRGVSARLAGPDEVAQVVQALATSGP